MFLSSHLHKKTPRNSILLVNLAHSPLYVLRGYDGLSALSQQNGHAEIVCK